MGSHEENKFGEYFLDQIIEFVHEYFVINELFTKEEIESWLEDTAQDYGYVKEE